MGWMKGQRLDEHVMKLADREAWLRLSEEECARLPQMVEGGLDENSEELSIGYMAGNNLPVVSRALCLKEPLDAPCAKATIRDWVLHLYPKFYLYPKCLLGGEHINGAAAQIAWCFARACVT